MPLLADKNARISKAYCVYDEESGVDFRLEVVAVVVVVAMGVVVAVVVVVAMGAVVAVVAVVVVVVVVVLVAVVVVMNVAFGLEIISGRRSVYFVIFIFSPSFPPLLNQVL